MIILLALFVQGEPLVNLESHGIFNVGGLGFYRVGPNTLVSNAHLGVLQVFDHRWKPIHRFDRVGPGPEEIERPIILGVTKDRILVINRWKSVLAFDHQLTVQDTDYPPIDAHHIKFGYHVDGNRFRVFGNIASPYLIWEISLNEGRWIRTGGLFTRPKKDRAVHPFDVFSQGSTAYITDNPFVLMTGMTGFPDPPDDYEVQAHDMDHLRKNLVQVFRRSTVGLEGMSGHLRLVHGVFRKGESYFVHLVFFRPPDNHRVAYLDKFGMDASFQGRKQIDDRWYFYPIMGTDDVVQVDRENLLIYRFHL